MNHLSDSEASRQQRQDKTNLFVTFGVVLVSALAVEVSKNLLGQDGSQLSSVVTRQSSSDYKLDDDVNCGVTTGGKELCTEDCRSANGVFADPECLRDCFQEDCIQSLLDDYKNARGVCPGKTYLYYNYIDAERVFKILPPAVCDQKREYQIQASNGSTFTFRVPSICSSKTVSFFQTGSLETLEKCIPQSEGRVIEGPPKNATIAGLWDLLCPGMYVFHFLANLDQFAPRPPNLPYTPPWYVPFVTDLDISGPRVKKIKRWLKNKHPKPEAKQRYNPLYFVSIDYTVNNGSDPGVLYAEDFTETRNRYPWICSLRRKDAEKTHICAVTLLRRPPGPTVMVTSAHCTLICKDGPNMVDNCCCDNVNEFKCDSFSTNITSESCGANATVYIVGESDAEVVCGDWEIGNATQQQSEERYNIIFTIKV